MAKLAYSKLKLKTEIPIVKIEVPVGDDIQIVEVKTYLPIEEKITLLERVINLAQEYLSKVILFYFPLGMLIMYRSALQGMGNSIIPLYSGLLELIMRTLAVIILSKYFGYLGVCLAGPAAWFSGAILLTIGYYNTFRHLIIKLRKSTSKEDKEVLV